MISLVLPTRKRPSNLFRLWQSVVDTAKNPVELCLRIDSDDTTSVEVAEEIGAKYVVGKRDRLTKCWNEAYELASGDIIGFMGDDVVFRTTGWDVIVRGKMKENKDMIGYVYGRDGYQPDSFGTHGFVHQNWIKAVGYFCPEYAKAWSDQFFNRVSKRIGRHFFIDVLVEHMHWVNGKAEMDSVYREKESLHPYNDYPEEQGAVSALKTYIHEHSS